MLKKTIKYTDYFGNEREEVFCFNLSQSEIAEIQWEADGGDLEAMLNRIIRETDTRRLKDMFKEIILRSYGEISPDGRRFVKSEELSNSFYQTEAYSNLFIELLQDTDKLTEFVNAIIPKIPDEKNAVAKLTVVENN